MMKKATAARHPVSRKFKLLCSCIRDFCRGVDFTVPDRMYDRGRNDGAMYYATPQKLLQEIFGCIDPAGFPNFLDIGCGKGFVLWKAWEYGFQRVGGIDFDEKMIQICQRNLQKLGLEKAIQPVFGDACQFDRYADYDIFYFYNPFPAATMASVIQQIIAQCKGKEIRIVYFRPRYPEAIESSGLFECRHTFRDKDTGYIANVYHGIIPR